MNDPTEQTCVKVWVDVGGTFTDCYVVDLEGKILRQKVLSSGTTKGAAAVGSTNAVILDPLRAEEPAGFWRGFQFCLLDEAGSVLEQRQVVDSKTIAAGPLPRSAVPAPVGELCLDSPLETPLSAESLVGCRYELHSDLEAPVLAVRRALKLGLDQPLPPLDVRLGTTRGTNALLTRTGEPTALLITEGFGDLLRIGSQERPELFALHVQKPAPLTELVYEVRERLAADGTELLPLDQQRSLDQLQLLWQQGIRSLAVCLLHAFQNDRHELQLESLARQVGFTNISISSRVAPLIKLLMRAETTTLDAYLNPILADYVTRVWQQFGGEANAQLRLMTSGGQLVAGSAFRGRDSVLSGPAGGVVALAALADGVKANRVVADSSRQPATSIDGVIGFDMGGTSTDVSRYQGQLVRQFEGRKAGVRIMTPMMAIHTVAAGGGSLCTSDHGRLFVGPNSAGSNPGPACYGRGGPLCVTDLNLLLGRVVPSAFPFPLDAQAAKRRLEAIQQDLAKHQVTFEDPLQLAEGFWDIAVHHMAEAVRTVSTAEGADPRRLALVSFGGAAGQHACAVAESLKMRVVIDHPEASMFSALGMGLAPIGRFASHGVYQQLDQTSEVDIDNWVQQLRVGVERELTSELQNGSQQQACFRATCELRYRGTESTLSLDLYPLASLAQRFADRHQQSFGYRRQGRAVELVTIRVDGEIASEQQLAPQRASESIAATTTQRQQLYLRGSWVEAALFHRGDLLGGHQIEGPAMIASPGSTLVIPPDWSASVCNDGTIVCEYGRQHEDRDGSSVSRREQGHAAEVGETATAVQLEIISRRLEGIAEQMGEVLRRTAVSVNVKERLDYSCAVFTKEGWLVAGAMHVPVHLGAMGHTVRCLMQAFPTMSAGDCYVSNDPYRGGSHLPDVTVVTPVFVGEEVTGRPDYFVASRAHHAEIGGLTPGSMPPEATCLAEEGVLLRSFPLIRNGVESFDELRRLLCEAKYPSRTPEENLADLAAQVAAGRRGADDLIILAKQHGSATLAGWMERLLEMSADAMQPLVDQLRGSEHRYEDVLIDTSKIAVRIAVVDERLVFDFEGTSAVHPRGWNATPAIVSAAVLYVLRCLSPRPLPLSEGVLRRVELRIPTGLLNPPANDNPELCPAVVAGNVETSQRVVDCLLGALGVAAASQGTMNNLLIGDATFGYYETICGGTGAVATGDGADAVHSHMTNTRITDPEIVETRYPLRLRQFAVRRGSGGDGFYRGGDGVIREFEFLRPLTLSLLTSRRDPPGPFGLSGGANGSCGRNILVHGTTGSEETLPATVRREVNAGDRLRIETPGGGGYGDANSQ